MAQRGKSPGRSANAAANDSGSAEKNAGTAAGKPDARGWKARAAANRSATPAGGKAPAVFPQFLVAGFLALVLLQFSALTLGWDRIWGFDMLRWLSPANIIYYAIIAAGTLALLLYLRRTENIPDERILLTIVLALGVLQIVCPIETFFYGDGGLLIPQIHRYSVSGDFDAELLWNAKSSPLAGGLIILFMKAVPSLLPWKPDTALYPFVWVSALSLAGAAACLFFVYRGMKRAVVLLALIGTAGALLFRGYAEFYAPVFAAIAVYLAAGERAARGEAKLWQPVAAFAVAVAAHYMALVLLPSLVYIIAVRRKLRPVSEWNFPQALKAVGIAFAAGIVLYFVLGFHDSASRIVMPIADRHDGTGTQSYTLLSLAHIADAANLLILLAPLAVVTLAALWPGFLQRKERDTSTIFHALAVLFFLAFAFFVNASLGIARDWDLLSPLGIILLFAAIAAMEHSRIRYGALGLVIASLIVTVPWQDLHRDPDATADRFAAIMQLDDEHMYADYALSGYDALRKFRGREGDHAREIPLPRRMIELADYPQHYREFVLLAQGLDAVEDGRADAGTEDGRKDGVQDTDRDVMRDGRQDAGLDAGQKDGLQDGDLSRAAQFQWMLDRLARKAGTLAQAGGQETDALSMRTIDSLAQAVGLLAAGTPVMPEIRSPLSDVAAITRDGHPFPAVEAARLYDEGRYDTAAVLFRESLAEGFSSPELYLLFGNALALGRQYSASLSRFEEGVRRYPESGILRFTLGKYYLRAGIQLERAAELLLWCIEHNDPPDKTAEVRELLQRLVR